MGLSQFLTAGVDIVDPESIGLPGDIHIFAAKSDAGSFWLVINDEDPSADAAYAVVPNGSLVHDKTNHKIWSKSGDFGATDGTFVAI